MPDDMPPSLFELLRSDIRDMRTDFNNRLDKLVSTDAFTAEQKRRDEQYQELTKDIAAESAEREKGLLAERLAREAGIDREKQSREKAHAETDQRSRRAWAAVRWTLGTLIAGAAVVSGYWALFVR